MHKTIDGTSYHSLTDDKAIEVLENSRHTKKRIVLVYGDVNTGKVWGDIDRGHIGRSTGDIKIPIIIKTCRSTGGHAILDHCILEIRESVGGKVLYKK